jgi:hypothetical protein
MSKNMTRKGLAFGAGLSLIVSGFAGVPASAAGINDDSVSLLPALGAEYDIIAGADLRLKANMATGVLGTGKYLKFQVADSLGKTTVNAAGSSVHTVAGTEFVQTAADEIVTLTVAEGHKFKIGDRISVTGADETTNKSTGTAVASTTATEGNGSSANEVVVLTIASVPQGGDVITVTNAATANVVVTLTNAQAATVTTAALAVLTATNAATGAKYNAAQSAGVITFTGKDFTNHTQLGETYAFGTVVPANINVTTSLVTAVGTTSVSYTGATITADNGLTTDATTISLLASTPVSGVYIFDTKEDGNTSDQTIQLASTDQNVTQTVVVTAWVDSNNDGDIDTTEYASPARTVRFLATGDITPTVAWNPISVGDTTTVANVTFSPVLNGAQLTSAATPLYQSQHDLNTVAKALTVSFTRPGTAEIETSATTSYSNVTKQWTATSINMDAAAWAITDAAVGPANAANTVAIKDGIVTIATNAATSLRVGDIVAVKSSTANTNANNATATVLSVLSTKSFTYAVTTANAAAADLSVIADAAVQVAIADAGNKILRDFATIGDYTAQVNLFKFDAVVGDALTAIGTKSATGVGASVASATTTAPTFEGVPTALVSAGDGAAAAVKTGTTASNFLLSVYDKKGNAVGAGVDVLVTTTTVTTAGVITVNGVKRITGGTFVAVTDANGQVALAVTNSSAAATEALVLDATVQGVAATQFTATWSNASYSIYDTADTTTNGANRNRAVEKGGSYTFNLRVVDQWGAALDSATHRLLVQGTQNSIVSSSQTLTLNNGVASATVSDAGQSGDTAVSAIVQKLVATVWTNQVTNDDAFSDWNGAGSGDLANVLIKYYTQTDAITTNINGSALPSGTAADLAADVTTVALKAADTRFAGETANTYPAATKAVVGGKVTNANTGVSKAGSLVTLSAPGVLFNDGGVWSIDSITVIANDGTFSVDAYSRVAGKIVVTATVGAVSTTSTVTYSAVGTVAGYTVELSAPATVQSGSTFRVQGQIKDVNGNGVPLLTAGTGTNPTLKVAYQGLGLVSGSLPTTTDASGNFYFYVLVGSNDVGSGTVTVSYDIDGTSTTNAAVAKSATIFVGQTAPSTTKVNVGSFKGYVALYAKGYKGKKMSAIVAGKWIVVASLATDFERVVRYTGAGYDIVTTIYIDGVKVQTFNVTTK